MKRLVFILIWIGFPYWVQSQSSFTIVFQPGSCEGVDALIGDCIPCGYNSTNYGNVGELDAVAWTNGGNSSNARGLFQFDLSLIPSNATITNASLSLFWAPVSSNLGHSQLSGPNDGWLKRITSPWDENTVTWDTQPLTTNVNQVALPASISSSQNYTGIDVTLLIQDMANNPSSSFGFLLQLQNETYYRSLVFASSDYPDSNLHPKLEVTFTLPTAFCFTLQAAECIEGKDALIGSCVTCGYNNTNFGNVPELDAVAWTNGGEISNARGLLQFDLSAVPSNATIVSADLSLYWAPVSSNLGHSQLSGSNEGLLRRIISSWDEQTVTWDTQPATTTQNEVILPASITSNQDYTNIDVTALIQDMVADPAGSFGFMLQLLYEQYYRSLVFASSDYPDASLHPKLDVCYSILTGIENVGQNEITFSIYPNPVNDQLIIEMNELHSQNLLFEIYNVYGQKVKTITKETGGSGQSKFKFPVEDLPCGVYFLSAPGQHLACKQFIKL